MKKWKSQKGFTLIELMISCVLLLIFGEILVTGVKIAADSLTNSTAYAEAQTLNGTLNNAISEQIRFQGRPAEDFAVKDGVVTVEGASLISKKAYPNGLKVKTLSVENKTTGKNDVNDVGNIFEVGYEIIGPNNTTVAKSNFQVKSHG